MRLGLTRFVHHCAGDTRVIGWPVVVVVAETSVEFAAIVVVQSANAVVGRRFVQLGATVGKGIAMDDHVGLRQRQRRQQNGYVDGVHRCVVVVVVLADG